VSDAPSQAPARVLYSANSDTLSLARSSCSLNDAHIHAYFCLHSSTSSTGPVAHPTTHAPANLFALLRMPLALAYLLAPLASSPLCKYRAPSLSLPSPCSALGECTNAVTRPRPGRLSSRPSFSLTVTSSYRDYLSMLCPRQLLLASSRAHPPPPPPPPPLPHARSNALLLFGCGDSTPSSSPPGHCLHYACDCCDASEPCHCKTAAEMPQLVEYPRVEYPQVGLGRADRPPCVASIRHRAS
jgi:hypothetical protein